MLCKNYLHRGLKRKLKSAYAGIVKTFVIWRICKAVTSNDLIFEHVESRSANDSEKMLNEVRKNRGGCVLEDDPWSCSIRLEDGLRGATILNDATGLLVSVIPSWWRHDANVSRQPRLQRRETRTLNLRLKGIFYVLSLGRAQYQISSCVQCGLIGVVLTRIQPVSPPIAF